LPTPRYSNPSSTFSSAVRRAHQMKTLEYEAEGVAAQPGPVEFGELVDGTPADLVLAASGPVDEGDQV